MDNFCRGCLIQFKDPNQLLQYTEKNRRQFLYATSIQVKRNNMFTFQICRSCSSSLQDACKFKKQCRTSERKIRSYLVLKESGEELNFYNFIKNTEDFVDRGYRLDKAIDQKNGADDSNDIGSPSMSISNFMTDILKDDDIPSTEARIIREVIEEEADISDDSLDSMWLRDDVTVDNDLNMDLSFSSFLSPKSVNIPSYDPKQDLPNDIKTIVNELTVHERQLNRCGIDVNLERALNKNKEQCFVNDLLLSPVPTGCSTPQYESFAITDKGKIHLPDNETIKFIDNNRNVPEKSMPNMENVLDIILTDDDSSDDIHEVTETVPERFESVIYTYTHKDTLDCKICKDIFENEKFLIDHYKERHSIALVTKKRYRNNYSSALSCEVCGKQFYQTGNLKRHVKTHEKDDVTHRCTICFLVFKTKTALKIHKRAHTSEISEKPKPKDNEEYKYICSSCGYRSNSQSNLRVHEKRHNRQFSYFCEQCDKGFVRKFDLTSHLRTHSGVKQFPCTMCTAKFARSDALTIHIRTRHTGEGSQYYCFKCNMTYKRKMDYNSHTCLPK